MVRLTDRCPWCQAPVLNGHLEGGMKLVLDTAPYPRHTEGFETFYMVAGSTNTYGRSTPGTIHVYGRHICRKSQRSKR